MAKDLLYDKNALLEELSKSGVDHKVITPRESSESVEELHELFGQAVGLPKEPVPEAPKSRAPRMTHQQLTAMKVVSKKVQDPKVSLIQKLTRVLNQVNSTFKSWFAADESVR